MRLAILGASGHGKVVADAAERAGWPCITFFDDAWPSHCANGPWMVEGDTQALLAEVGYYDGVIVAIGDNRLRSEKQAALVAVGAKLALIVHPAAVVSPHAYVGKGSVVFANAVVNASARIGDGAIVNTGAVIEHDCIVADFAHISPNAMLAGGATVGSQAWIGGSASVKQLINVGGGSVVGMGAVVVNDVPPGVVVVGNPASIPKSLR